MQSDPLLNPLDSRLLVSSIDPETGFGQPNLEWEEILGGEDDPFGNLEAADRDAAGRLVRLASEGSMTVGELMLIPAEPEPRPVLLNFIPVHRRGQATGFMVVVTGEMLEQPGSWTEVQTEQHRMEALGRMTMGIAHDFNNLLSGILGHAELMKSALERDLDPELLAEHVRTIERAAADGGVLIKKIQSYIRREQKAALKPLDLPALIQDCIVLTRPYWYNEPRRQGIAISIEQELQVVPAIMGSAAELRDVMVNLILNAVQAMPGGGVISVKTWHAAERVYLSITDNGTGMSDEVLARIFEPGFTTKGRRGNGVGLGVVLGLVREHSGEIAVESVQGRGTTFQLEFPRGTGDAGTEGSETVAQPPSPELRILIVDDELMVRAVLRKLLTLRGHTVVEAASGPAALEVLSRESFDVIITDQGMPEMNGREFAGRARLLLPDIPIVLLTGDTHVGSVDHVISAVLAKPFKIDVVESTITQLVALAD